MGRQKSKRSITWKVFHKIGTAVKNTFSLINTGSGYNMISMMMKNLHENKF